MLFLKKVINCYRSFLLAPFVLYVFDRMAVGIDVFIPINILTILIVGILEIPGLMMLIALNVIIF